MSLVFFFFFNDTATTEIYTLSLHDALPIWSRGRTRTSFAPRCPGRRRRAARTRRRARRSAVARAPARCRSARRSEEHTSELQSRQYLVCRLLLEKKKKTKVKC